MSAVIVRYELDPSRIEEHVGLIRDVFDYLRAAAPEGVHYGVLRSADGMEFTHIGVYDSPQAQQAASGNAAFKAFVSEIKSRCKVPPNAVTQEVVEGFGVWER